MRIPAWLRDLERWRGRFGTQAAQAKRARLSRAARDRLADPRVLRRYHDHLLFMLAHPDDPEIRRRAGRELRRVAALVRARLQRPAARPPAAWRDSGIAGSTLTYAFSMDLARWLSRRFGDNVTLVWPGGTRLAALEEMLPELVPPAERDGLLSRDLSTREWLRLARGPRDRDDLAWVVDRFQSLPGPPGLRDRLFDALELAVRWRLRAPLASRTFQRFPPRPIHYQKAAFRRPDDTLALVRAPAPRAGALPARPARAVIEVSRAALAVRQRETDPATYANPREVYLFRLERGVDVAILGLARERRLPIESYFGYAAAKNRVPLAYGGGWIFLDRAEIGLNIFEGLRGGESADLFAQILRVYRHLFRVRRFLVEPFQIGEDNEEAIESGAFWFYYRLGFRPRQRALAALAAREWARCLADPRRRTPARILRRLAAARLQLRVVPEAAGEPETPDLVRVSLGVTREVGRRFGADRARAQAWARRRAVRALGVRSTARWPAAERAAFDELAWLAAPCPDLAGWTPADKRALVAALRAKAGARELPFVRRLRGHRRLAAWLARLDASARRARLAPRARSG